MTMYEHKKQPLAPTPVFISRLLKNLGLALIIMAICLGIGTAGYYYTCDNIKLLDAFHNSCMILSGMGPVIMDLCDRGKWFSSFYALFSGIAFITNISFIIAPVAHRFFHKLHIEEN